MSCVVLQLVLEAFRGNLLRTILETMKDNSSEFSESVSKLHEDYPDVVAATFSDLEIAHGSAQRIREIASGIARRVRKTNSPADQKWLRDYERSNLGRYWSALEEICERHKLRDKDRDFFNLSLSGDSWMSYLHDFIWDRPIFSSAPIDIFKFRPQVSTLPIQAPPALRRPGRPKGDSSDSREKQLWLAEAIGLRLTGLLWREVVDMLERSGGDPYGEQQLQMEAHRLAKTLGILLSRR